jgi:hypothetical protein
MKATIAPLPRAIAEYVGGFDLTALALTRDNRIITTCNPKGCAGAWWCKADDAGKLMRWLQQHESRDVLFAARALGVTVSEHDMVIRRAAAALARIEVGLDRAQKEGLLVQFNRAYKAHRLAAKAEGRRFMGYATAQARLRSALASAANGDKVEPAELFADVFGRTAR